MADRTAWLRALAGLVDDPSRLGNAPCPACGRSRIELRYIVRTGRRMGYALFWCHACLHGISVSRARAPEGMPVRTIDDADALAAIPEFVREE